MWGRRSHDRQEDDVDTRTGMLRNLEEDEKLSLDGVMVQIDQMTGKQREGGRIEMMICTVTSAGRTWTQHQ